MGHVIPYPYSITFIRLLDAVNNKTITLDRGHKTWCCVVKIWERNEKQLAQAPR